MRTGPALFPLVRSNEYVGGEMDEEIRVDEDRQQPSSSVERLQSPVLLRVD